MNTQEIIQEVYRSELGLLGVVIGTIVVTVLVFRYVDRRWTFIPRKKQRRHFEETFEAPAPAFQGKRHGEKVVICGAEWTIM